MEFPIINEEDILNRLKQININKSPGHDGLHPRILYEVRNEIVSDLRIISFTSKSPSSTGLESW